MPLRYRVRLFQILVALGIATFLCLCLSRSSLEVPLVIPHNNRHEVLLTPLRPSSTQSGHPIDTLIKDAADEWDGLLRKETKGLKAAAEAYRRRRGRHPPPRFDEWYRYAQERDALFVEDLFDRIYDDLNPFWALEPNTLRRQASTYMQRVSVRDGTASITADRERMRTTVFHSLISSIAEHLPDLDIAVNVMDESRIVVPWETLNRYIRTEQKDRKLVDPSRVVDSYTSGWWYDIRGEESLDWVRNGSHWSLARQGCHPNSPAARHKDAKIDLSEAPPVPNTRPPFSNAGYVGNWTVAKDVCVRPELHALHGAFVEPVSFINTQKLFPLFGECKLSVNNEILLPAAMYWSDDTVYSGGPEHGGLWEEKQDQVVWRGVASGGRNNKENWRFFQRHRFVSMMNGTSVEAAEQPASSPYNENNPSNFAIPLQNQYDVTAQQRQDREPTNKSSLGEWLKSITNVAFNKLLCFPAEADDSTCSYVHPYFSVQPEIPMAQQYNYKLLPDIDGNTFSGRYRGFLLSTSLPIKATIYNEWHDSRLIAWQHFVPMDNTFVDVYGLLQYFLGYRDDKEGSKGFGRRPTVKAHDDYAKAIARNGKAWAERVLRKEDMQIYVYRLLLEYARVCDDARDVLGYVGDWA